MDRTLSMQCYHVHGKGWYYGDWQRLHRRHPRMDWIKFQRKGKTLPSQYQCRIRSRQQYRYKSRPGSPLRIHLSAQSRCLASQRLPIHPHTSLWERKKREQALRHTLPHTTAKRPRISGRKIFELVPHQRPVGGLWYQENGLYHGGPLDD